MLLVTDLLDRARWLLRGTLYRLWGGLFRIGVALRIRPAFPPLYPRTNEQRVASKKAFIDTISHDAVCRLASRHRDQQACYIFDTKNGSFNVCFFVVFDDGKRWIVRIPMASVVHDPWAKVQCEVATMRYVQCHSTIPLPAVHAFGQAALVAGRPAMQAFIMDYVDGHTLDMEVFRQDTCERREHFYAQLIDVYAGLRALELPLAGSLMLDPRSGPAPILGPPTSIHGNELQGYGCDIAPRAPFASSTDFVRHQLRFMNELFRLPVNEQTLKLSQFEIFALDCLAREVPARLGACQDAGAFVLCHLDLRWPNILLDDDLNIQAVIDWEWTSAVPRQLFVPPPWITGKVASNMATDKYRAEYTVFHVVLQARKDVSGGHRKLAEEWTMDLLDEPELGMAELLHHPSDLVDLFYKVIYPKLYKEPRTEVVPRFFDDSQHRALALAAQRNAEASEHYTQYLRDSGLFVPNEILAYTRRVEDNNNNNNKF